MNDEMRFFRGLITGLQISGVIWVVIILLLR